MDTIVASANNGEKRLERVPWCSSDYCFLYLSLDPLLCPSCSTNHVWRDWHEREIHQVPSSHFIFQWDTTVFSLFGNCLLQKLFIKVQKLFIKDLHYFTSNPMSSQEMIVERGLQYKASIICVFKYFKAICMKLCFINKFLDHLPPKDYIKDSFYSKKGD